MKTCLRSTHRLFINVMFYLLGTDAINIDETEITVIPCMYHSVVAETRRAFINYSHKKQHIYNIKYTKYDYKFVAVSTRAGR